MEGTTQQRRKERLELGTRCAGIDRIQVALTIGGQDQKGGGGQQQQQPRKQGRDWLVSKSPAHGDCSGQGKERRLHHCSSRY